MAGLGRFSISVVIGLMLLAAVVSGQPVSCLNPSSTVVSYWAAEGNANDSADSNNGTLIGSAGFTTGEIGQAFSFNGTTDYVNVPNASNLNITGSLTLSAWIYLNAYSGEFAPVISKWDDISGSFRTYFLAVRPNGTLRFDVSTDGGFGGSSSALVISAGIIPLNTWTFVAGVFNSSAKTLTVYINGVSQGSVGTSFSTIFTNTRPLFIGAGDLGSNSRDFLNGRVDEARVFSAAVSAAELLCLAGQGGEAVCGHHTVHGHLVTTPPDGHDGDVSGIHHGDHGHTVSAATCIPAGHHLVVNGHILGLTPESTDGAIPNALTREPDFVAALNQDGLNAPSTPGTVVQLFGSARGLFLDLADLHPALGFTPSASGSPLYHTEILPEVQIGGVRAEVLFSGLAPGLNGVWQINIRVPDGTQLGKVPVTISYDGNTPTSVDLVVE